jgi:hypothetical protein
MRGGTNPSTGGNQHRPARRRWAAFLLVVLGLRVWGIGDEPPPRAQAEADPAAEGPNEDQVIAARALGWLVTGVDVFEHGDATSRCLRAGATCTADDMLAVDTTRARLESLGLSLAEAADPSHPAYLGDPGQDLTARGAQLEEAVAAAADRIGAWLSSGCGSSVEGLPVPSRPDGCADLGDQASDALTAAREALDAWSG